jgi:outer membrane protein TolC
LQNQLQYARSNVQNASDYLGVLLGEEEMDLIYQPAERAPETTRIENFDYTLPESRKDIAAMDKAVQGYEKMVNARKFNFVPRINAFGSFQLYDDQLLGFDASGYLVGVQLSWQLFNGYQSVGKLSKARTEYEKARLESDQYRMQSQMELNQANRKLKDAENKVELKRLAMEQSEESYRIRKDRFEEGLEKTTDLLQAETRMFQKELEYLQAIFEYNYTKEYLNFLTR